MHKINSIWAPFQVIECSATGEKPAPLPKPRAVHTREGMGDRMRSAAFAERQAVLAFSWAAENFVDAPKELRDDWRNLAKDEARHCELILNRMMELGILVDERPVNSRLLLSLTSCETAEKFTHFIANSEERGRQAGILFANAVQEYDPVTAEIFRKICDEEVDHISLALKFFPRAPVSDSLSGQLAP